VFVFSFVGVECFTPWVKDRKPCDVGQRAILYALAPDAHLSQIVDVALGISELTLLFFFVAKFIDQVASVYKALKSLFGR
jgi:hypothetical protein